MLWGISLLLSEAEPHSTAASTSTQDVSFFTLVLGEKSGICLFYIFQRNKNIFLYFSVLNKY